MEWSELAFKDTIVYSTMGMKVMFIPYFLQMGYALYLSDFLSELSKGTFITVFKIPWF